MHSPWPASPSTRTPDPNEDDTMATTVTLPELGESVTEGTVTTWL
ncbi:hypothetical protein, partial [Aeromicrobium sp. Leaf245]